MDRERDTDGETYKQTNMDTQTDELTNKHIGREMDKQKDIWTDWPPNGWTVR